MARPRNTAARARVTTLLAEERWQAASCAEVAKEADTYEGLVRRMRLETHRRVMARVYLRPHQLAWMRRLFDAAPEAQAEMLQEHEATEVQRAVMLARGAECA